MKICNDCKHLVLNGSKQGSSIGSCIWKEGEVFSDDLTCDYFEEDSAQTLIENKNSL